MADEGILARKEVFTQLNRTFGSELLIGAYIGTAK